MKKRTLLGLCLSIFSLFLFSCGIAESNDGSATLNVDTATIVQRSIKSANFELSEDEIFEQYAEYLNYELTAIVNYEIGGKSENKTFSLFKMNGKEAYEQVEKLQNMSGEDEKAYFVENFSSQTLTITDLPIGKNATFRLKIRQKIGFNIDLSEYGLSESEISKDEYLAISKEPVSTKITENTDITIKLTEYSSSLDWDVVSWTLTGTFPSEWSSDLEFQNGEIFIYKKTGSTWNLVDTVILTSENPGFTVTSNRGTGSGTTKNLSTGDTAMLTIRMMYAYNESAGGHTCFAGWSKEVTCASGKNVFDMGEVTYKANFWGNPAPTTTASVLVTSENEITAKYGTIKVYKTDYSSETEQSTSTDILTKEIELSDWVKTSSSKDNSGYSSYQATYTFSDISAFASIEEGANLEATLILYEDAAREKQVNDVQGYCSGFYKDCSNVFNFYIYDGSGSSGSGVSEATVTVSALQYNDSSLDGKVFNFSKDGDSSNYFKFEGGEVYWSSDKSTWDNKSSEFYEKGKYIVNWGASYGITETPALSRTSGSGLCSTFSSGEVSCTFTSDGTCSYSFSSEEDPVTFNKYTNNGGVIDCGDGFVALYTGSSLYVVGYVLNVVE